MFDRMVKRARTLMRRSTAFEIVSELVSFRLPVDYKMMRLVARSDTARRLAVKAFARRHPIRCSDPAARSTFAGISTGRIISALEHEGFANGLSLSESVLCEILAFCANATFLPNKARDESLRIDLERATNPALQAIFTTALKFTRSAGQSQLSRKIL